MGNCLLTCFGRSEHLKIKNPAALYSEDLVDDVEFENLLHGGDSGRPGVSRQTFLRGSDNWDSQPRLLTPEEIQAITQKKIEQIKIEQQKENSNIEAQFAREEEDLRLEEEAFIEAKREAARRAKERRIQTSPAPLPLTPPKTVDSHSSARKDSFSAWLADDAQLEMDGIDVSAVDDIVTEDFDAFLESVKRDTLSQTPKSPNLASGQEKPTLAVVSEAVKSEHEDPWVAAAMESVNLASSHNFSLEDDDIDVELL
eukprot:Colp12_sorted_trinity150504_noHs@22876